MEKNRNLILGILIILIIIFIFKPFLFSILNISDSTTYSSVSYSKDTITYSNIDRDGSLNGFTSTHRIGENINFENAGITKFLTGNISRSDLGGIIQGWAI